jgi:hypothetical protein
VKTRLTVAALLTVALGACSHNSQTAVEPTPAAVTPAPAAQLPPTPTPAVSVAAVKLVQKPAVRRVVPTLPKVWPVTIYRKPIAKPRHFICYIGQPCNPPPQYWTLTIGCTGAWRVALHRTTCPTGQPFLP